MSNKIEGMIIKQGRTTIDITEQDDCVVVVRRVWCPHKQATETTPMIIHKETFVAMFDAMAEAVNFAK